MENKLAIVGTACRFPGAKSAHQYWHNLVQGRSCITDVPASRWQIEDHYAAHPKKNYSTSKWGGFVEDFEHFDAAFFGVSPREAQLMDPQQRIMLELAVHCVEDAGYSLKSFDSSSTGVFIGVCNFDYKEELEKKLKSREGHMATGTYSALIPNRVSFFMNLKGPSLPIDTACSSSLVALSVAMNAIQNGECDADGYVRGEGAGFVLVKPLHRALADNDSIYAVISGVAVNHSGRVPTVTSPSAYAQSQVISSAMQRAGITPEQISYIEAHGTGTLKGDPIEINGLKRAYSALTRRLGGQLKPGSCVLGSAKTHIGHLESASGIAGLIKVLLSIEHQYLPPLLHFSTLNPRIKLNDSPFVIPNGDGVQWSAKPRRAAVSSFGFGGVNAHAILSEYSSVSKMARSGVDNTGLLIVSAHNADALRAYALLLQSYIERHPSLDLANLAYSMTRRTQHRWRLAVLFTARDDLLQKLLMFCNCTGIPEGVVWGEVKLPSTSLVVHQSEVGESLADLSQSWIEGKEVDWRLVFPHAQNTVLRLPVYPFQHRHYFPKEFSHKQPFSHQDKPAAGRELKPSLWRLQADWQYFSVVDREHDNGEINDTTLVCLLADSTTSVYLSQQVKIPQLLELPLATMPCAQSWIKWLWSVIVALRDAIKQRTPKYLVLLSNQADCPAETLFALLRSMDKEFQLPCRWLQWEAQDNDHVLKKLGGLLTQPTKITCAQRLVVTAGQLGLEQLSYQCKAFAQNNAPSFDGKPVFMITGGAGGIGLAICQYLCERYDADVILIGRQARGVDSFTECAKGGGSVAYHMADCTDQSAMQNVLKAIMQRFDRLDGVIHAAGIVEDKSVFFKTEQDVKRVVTAKVLGCEVLDKITADLPITYFIGSSPVCVRL